MTNKHIADHFELYNQHTVTEAFYSRCTASLNFCTHSAASQSTAKGY